MSVQLLVDQLWPLVIAVVLLRSLSLGSAHRYQQWFMPIVAGIVASAVGYLLWRSISASGALWLWPSGVVIGTSVDAYFLNLAILYLFVAIKTVFITVWYLSRLIRPMLSKRGIGVALPDEPGVVADIFYQSHASAGVVLRGEWVFPATMMLIFSTLVCLLFAALGVDALYPLDMGLPALPSLALIVFLEVAFFLGGPRPVLAPGETGQSASPQQADAFEKLWEECQQLWPEQRLLAGRFRTPQDSRDKSLEDRLCVLLNEGKSVIVESPNFSIMKVAIEARIKNLLTARKKILVLADGYAARDDARAWLGAVIPSLWQVHLYHPKTANAGLREGVNLSEAGWFIANHSKQHVSTAGVACVLFLGERRLIVEGVAAQFIDQLYSANKESGIQYVIVSEARHGLESSLRTNLPVFTRELEHARRYPTTSFFILWRQESNARFQDAVSPSSFSPTHLGIEPVLAIPAWRDGIEVIRFAESAALPIDEYIEEIDNHRNHFEGGPIDNRDLESAGALRYKHRRWGSPWQVERPPKAYILVRDFYFNLAVSLDRWLPLAEKEALVHVVSPPYLLRDYLADNIDFFLMTPLHPLTPRVAASESSIAMELLEMLTKANGATEKEVSSLLNLIPERSQEKSSTAYRIEALFTRVFKLRIMDNKLLEIREKHVFTSKKFASERRFQIDGSIKNGLPDWTPDYSVVNEANEHVGLVAGEHLAQTILPGQIRTWWREHYICTHIDAENHRVLVTHKLTESEPIYRAVIELQGLQIRATEAVSQALPSHRRVGEWWMSTKILSCDLKATTRAYFAFEKAISPESATSKFVRFDALPKWLSRTYGDGTGRVLEIRFEPARGGAMGERTMFTMATLFNELLPSLFPESHHLIFAIAPAGFSKQSKIESMTGSVTDYLTRYRLKQHLADYDSAILVFEDSSTDLGMLYALRDSIEHIIGILYDYLIWVTDTENTVRSDKHSKVPGAEWRGEINPAQRLDFLKFGDPDLSELLDLDDLKAFFATLGYAARRDTLAAKRASYRARQADPHDSIEVASV